MTNELFVTATGTNIGKTYISALIVKTLRENGINCGYYKVAASGSESIEKSDAGYVNRIGQIGQQEDTLLSYIYKTPVSPHLASNLEGNPVDILKIKEDYRKLTDIYDFVLTEGSGGIICPLRFDIQKQIMIEDIIEILDIPVLVIADSGLGTINSTVLTIFYLKSKGFKVSGIVINNFENSLMHTDNIKMIEELSNIEVVAKVKKNADTLDLDVEKLKQLFGRSIK